MSVKTEIYLDSNAGAPLNPLVLEALLSFLSHPSNLLPNPSSIHSHGRRAKKILSEAREKIAHSLGSKTDLEQLVFTSSGSESNQLAIRSALESKLQSGAPVHWITSPVEHDSVKQMVGWFEQRGGEVSYLPVDQFGQIEVASLPQLIRPHTALVSAVWVNNETGVISDVGKLSKLARKIGVPLHVDAAQAWGKLPVDLDALSAQWVSFSGHKIGGLAGSGLLWVGRASPIQATLLGKQEKGRRGCTENLLGILALGAAASQLNPKSWVDRLEPLRDRLESLIGQRIPGTRVNGRGAPRVANTSNLSFEGVEGEGLVLALDMAGYSVSSGSACSSGVLEPSHVLMAMGYNKREAMAAVRISLNYEISWETLEYFVTDLERIVARIRKARAFSA